MNEDIKEMISNAGLRQWEVADAMGVEPTTFGNMLMYPLNHNRRLRIIRIVESLRKEDFEPKIIEMYNQGIPQKAIAKSIGCSEMQMSLKIRKLIEAGKLVKRPQRMKKAESEEAPSIGVRCRLSVSRTCKYGCGANPDSGLCNYILIEHHSRPCSGKACTCYVKRSRKRDSKFKF